MHNPIPPIEMINIGIIDDEEDSREVLKSLLKKYYPQCQIVGEADGVSSGIEMLNTAKPQLLFLDISLKDGNGFDIISAIGPVNFEIVFITGHNNFAIKAYEASAIGYLLKPIDIDKLGDVIARVEKIINNPTTGFNHQLEALFENYLNKRAKNNTLAIASNRGYEVVDFDTIIRCEGDRNYTNIP